MVAAESFCQALRRRGYDFWTGVPCSTFKGVINHILATPELPFVMAANEGAAVGLAAGSWLAGRKPVVLLQSSGFGNLLNPLTSLSLSYRMPMLLVISGRAYPDGVGDEPQHRLMGASLRDVLRLLGVRRADLPLSEAASDANRDDAWEATLDDLDGWVEADGVAALVVPPGGLTGRGTPPPWEADYPLSRADALARVAAVLDGSELVVSTTGKLSRELFLRHDRQGNFYMQGSMGHARAIALGAALAEPARRVVVLDGDGACLMHLGSLSTVGHYAPANLLDVVLDNEAHGSTGHQHTTSSTTDLARTAEACGYRRSFQCADGAALDAALAACRGAAGPSFLLVKINRQETPDLPRITATYSQETTARRARDFVVAAG